MENRLTRTKNAANPDAAKLQRARAKQAGLTLEQYRVLLCLRSEGRPLTRQEIRDETGYFENLAKTLRAESSPDSLGARGLVLEQTDGHRKLQFEITDAGMSLLRSVDKWTPPVKVKRRRKGEGETVVAEGVDGVACEI